MSSTSASLSALNFSAGRQHALAGLHDHRPNAQLLSCDGTSCVIHILVLPYVHASPTLAPADSDCCVSLSAECALLSSAGGVRLASHVDKVRLVNNYPDNTN